jgi:hypothetical protein
MAVKEQKWQDVADTTKRLISLDPVDFPGVEKNALGERGLTGINVGHDADIPVTLERGLTRHDASLPHNQSWMYRESTTCLSIVESAVMNQDTGGGGGRRAVSRRADPGRRGADLHHQ